jgi:hypothetical protein
MLTPISWCLVSLGWVRPGDRQSAHQITRDPNFQTCTPHTLQSRNLESANEVATLPIMDHGFHSHHARLVAQRGLKMASWCKDVSSVRRGGSCPKKSWLILKRGGAAYQRRQDWIGLHCQLPDAPRGGKDMAWTFLKRGWKTFQPLEVGNARCFAGQTCSTNIFLLLSGCRRSEGPRWLRSVWDTALFRRPPSVFGMSTAVHLRLLAPKLEASRQFISSRLVVGVFPSFFYFPKKVECEVRGSADRRN